MQSICEMTAGNTVEIGQKYMKYTMQFNHIIMIVKQQSHAIVIVLKTAQS